MRDTTGEGLYRVAIGDIGKILDLGSGGSGGPFLIQVFVAQKLHRIILLHFGLVTCKL